MHKETTRKIMHKYKADEAITKEITAIDAAFIEGICRKKFTKFSTTILSIVKNSRPDARRDLLDYVEAMSNVLSDILDKRKAGVNHAATY